jgi:hypothetical protein
MLRAKTLHCGLLALVAWTQLSCVDERPAPVVTAADCEPTLRLPMSPRIVAVREDGSLLVGPACATANCLAGAPAAWGYRGDDDTIHVVVGQRALQLPPAAGDAPPSRLAAQNAVRGFVIGRGIAVIDRGAELEIVLPESSVRVPAPPLAGDEEIRSAWHIDDGVGLWIPNARPSQDFNPGRAIQVIPMKTPRPPKGRSRILDLDHHFVGQLVPGDPGSVLLTSGSTVRLSMAIPPLVSHARMVLDRFVVSLRNKSFIVGQDGAVIASLPLGAWVEAHAGVLYVVDKEASVFRVGERALTPWMVRAPGHDVAGMPLPDGSRVERTTMSMHDGRALVIERVRLRTCTVEDRVALVDIASKAARTLAGGDVVRLHPTFAGDRFRFVEADASYGTP